MSKPISTAYPQVTPFITKDGSLIRELMHPSTHGNHAQSLAEAVVASGGATVMHLHHHSEELYHVPAGEGRMRLGNEEFTVVAGDTICIPPGTPHSLSNPGEGDLRLLCCSSPPYSDEDTELLESSPAG